MNATLNANNRKGLRRRIVVLVGAASLLGPPALTTVATAASPPPAPTPAQRAEAIVRPSLVYVGVQWKGWVRLDSPVRLDGTLTMTGWQGPYTVNTACSGFVADATGHVVTAGHCVDDQSIAYGGKAAIIEGLVADVHSRFPAFSASQLDIVRNAVQANGLVEGKENGSPPQRTVTVYPSGSTTVTGLVASVVEYKGVDAGDVALLKATSKTPLAAVKVAPADPADGTAVVLAGYAGSVSALVDPGQEPSFKDGQTSSHQTIGGVPFTEVSAAATAGMSGGPALDMQGNVVGTVSFRPGSESGAFNFVSSTSTIRSLLTRNGVSNTLSAPDLAYRTGLTAFYARHYHAAVKAFDEVLAVQPDQASAQLYKRLSIENYPNEAKSSSSTPLYVGVGAGILVLLAAGTLLVLRRRRSGPPPAYQPPVPSPMTGPPAEQVTEPITGAVPTTAEVTPTVPVAEPVPSAAVAEPVVTEPVAPEVIVLPDVTPMPAAQPPLTKLGYCPNCGAVHEPDAHFCAECGLHFKPVAAARRGSNGQR